MHIKFKVMKLISVSPTAFLVEGIELYTYVKYIERRHKGEVKRFINITYTQKCFFALIRFGYNYSNYVLSKKCFFSLACFFLNHAAVRQVVSNARRPYRRWHIE